MDFTHNEDRRMLADTLSRFLSDGYAIDVRHRIAASDEGWSRSLWKELAGLGVIGALFAEEAGGFGGGGFDVAVVFEEVGRRLVVEPFLGTLMAGRALARAGGHEALIADVIAGTTILAFAHAEPGTRHDLDAVHARAERDGDGWRLTGEKAVVPQLAAADRILVSARDGEGVALFLVEAKADGMRVRDYPMVDGGHGGELSLIAAPATRIGGEALVGEATAAGLVALAWEAVAIMDQLRDATLDYLRTRKQFGVPIGKFQALQHRMATVALEIEQARSAAINAAAALDGDPQTRDRAASAAKYTVGRAGTLAAEEAIQMHGGIGMTWELPLPHYAKRLTMIGHQMGDEDAHLERFAALGRRSATPEGAPGGTQVG
jgi:alkylation response protein AidB-like acyl-CoA dehydrogenase